MRCHREGTQDTRQATLTFLPAAAGWVAQGVVTVAFHTRPLYVADFRCAEHPCDLWLPVRGSWNMEREQPLASLSRFPAREVV